MFTLEKYEWTNTWWDVPSNTGKRILLVGDSITNAYRSHVKEIISDKAYVDMLASSRALDNPAFWTELHHMLELAEYDVIHFNNGLHGFHLSCEQYETHYDNIIQKLLKDYPKSKLILVLSTPITDRTDSGLLCVHENNSVIDRNKVVLRIAEKYGLVINNLYDLVLGKGEIKSNDGYHFHLEGQKLQAQHVSELILEVMKNH